MIGPIQILDIGKKGLFAHQYALSVTSHNIANVNTPGYTRQKVIVSPTEHLEIVPGPVGTGVKIDKIIRIRDELIELQVRDQTSQVGEWKRKSELLTQVEGILNEPSETGLAQAIDNFFNAWMDVANNPEERGPRRVVIERGTILTNTFHRYIERIETMVGNINEEIEFMVNEINLKAEKIAQLNLQIVKQEAKGGNANDLRDERDKLINEIGQLADVQAIENADHSVSVYLNYKIIVDRGSVVKLSTDTANRGDLKMTDILYQGKRMVPASGEIKGLLEIRDEELTNYIKELDTLAKSIKDEVNKLHMNGFDLYGNTGKEFFKGTSARNFHINPEIDFDPSLIAASETGAPGDGRNAFNISELSKILIMDGGNSTFSDFYRAFVSKIGATSATAADMQEAEQILLTNLQNYRDSVSGVSIDEEIANLINYQHAYQASARVISVADTMLDTIIGMLR